MKYKLIIDNGKPYEEEFNTKEEVLNYLEEIDKIDKEEYAYFDITILKYIKPTQKARYEDIILIDSFEYIDITDKIFKEFDKEFKK